MLLDRWLEPLLPQLRATVGDGGPILELGCGHGDDTAVLVEQGFAVTVLDLSAASVAIARLRAPGASIQVQDLREPLPVEPGSQGAVVASLSLQYFPWAETE